MYWYHLSIHDGNAQWTLFMLSSKPFFRDFTILLTCVAVYYVTSRTKSRHIIFISWESCWQYNFLMISWHIQMYRYTWTWIMDWMALLAFPRTSMQYTNESSASDVYVPSFEGYLLIILSDMTLDEKLLEKYNYFLLRTGHSISQVHQTTYGYNFMRCLFSEIYLFQCQ